MAPHSPSASNKRAVSLEKVTRPEGFERTPPTIVIEGVEELVEALLAA